MNDGTHVSGFPPGFWKWIKITLAPETAETLRYNCGTLIMCINAFKNHLEDMKVESVNRLLPQHQRKKEQVNV